MSVKNIANINSPTVPLDVTTSSARVALPQGFMEFLVVTNIGTSAAWACTDGATVVATGPTGNNMCIPAGGQVTFRPGKNTDTHIAAICATGTTTLSISQTNGI